jgi:drug/metabolite transporter (DMT)-like permease
MLGAALLFSLMGAGVKFASAYYGAGEIVFFRSAVGLVLMSLLLRVRGTPLATPVGAMHFWRSLAGVSALCLWFYAIGGLPLATAVTLNYMSSVWVALFLIGGSVLRPAPGQGRIDSRLVASVLAGFAGVALVLRPTIEQDQFWFGLCGLLSGLLAAIAYLQVSALGRAGEPEERVVFYFSLAGLVAGFVLAQATGGLQALTVSPGKGPAGLTGPALLLGIGALATAAQWMLTRAYAIGSALVNSALQYMGIVFSFALGVWLFDDPVTAQALAGIALIVAAGLAATALRSRVIPTRRPDAEA